MKANLQDIDDYLPLALNKITTPVVVKEAVTNALIHTDYSASGSQIQVAIFDVGKFQTVLQESG